MNFDKKYYDIYLTDGFLSVFCLSDKKQIKRKKISYESN